MISPRRKGRPCRHFDSCSGGALRRSFAPIQTDSRCLANRCYARLVGSSSCHTDLVGAFESGRHHDRDSNDLRRPFRRRSLPEGLFGRDSSSSRPVLSFRQPTILVQPLDTNRNSIDVLGTAARYTPVHVIALHHHAQAMRRHTAILRLLDNSSTSTDGFPRLARPS